MTSVLDRIAGGVVVSCQAAPGTPLAVPETIAALARAAELGGAVGLRIEGIDDIRAVRHVTRLPIIGLVKAGYEGSSVYITPTLEEVRGLVESGAEIIALDATARPRPREDLATLIGSIRSSSDALVMADVATLGEGIAALELGADLVGTTLHGYTDDSEASEEPAFDLIADLAAAGAWVVAEGRIRTASEAVRCYEAGARSVVVGGAITDPIVTTRRFSEAVGRSRRQGRG